MTVEILTKYCCLHAHKIIVVEMFSNQGQILEEHGAMSPQTMIKNQMVPQKPNSGFAPFSDYFFSVPSYVPSSFPSCPMQVCIYACKALAKRCQHLSQQMPTLLGIVGHCWMWGGQTIPTLVPNIYLLITATASTTTTQDELLYSEAPNTRPLLPLIFFKKIFQRLLLFEAPLIKLSNCLRETCKNLVLLLSYSNNE